VTGRAARHSPETASENLITARAECAVGRSGLHGFYGAIGFAILSCLLWGEAQGVLGRLQLTLAVIGRNSLMAFMSGYFVYFTVLVRLGLAYTPLWPAVFALSVTILVLAVLGWDRSGWNRHLTFRLPRSLAALLIRNAATDANRGGG